MKKYRSLLAIATCAAVLYGCAGSVPSELADARLAYQTANAGPAAQHAPAELHKAKEALDQAELSFSDDSGSYQTRDLAYVAQRRAQMADAQASIIMAQDRKDLSDKSYEVTQGALLKERTEDLGATRTALAVSEESGEAASARAAREQKARVAAENTTAKQSTLLREKSADLTQTRTALAASEQTGQATADQLAAEQKISSDAEKKAAVALAALAKLTAVREDARGTVISLSGSVLFRSNESNLMPGADSRLDQVVDALNADGDRNVVVEGYTDSQGSDGYNLDLSRRRAEVVRDYLVRRGYDASRIRSLGIGEANPIADNATAEGRANNRRVEIILERKSER